jgi:hypothetical protein
MDAIFRRDYPVLDGFPTIRGFNAQRSSSAMAEALDRISEVRRALSQPSLFEVSGVRSGRESCRGKLQACRRRFRSEVIDSQLA